MTKVTLFMVPERRKVPKSLGFQHLRDFYNTANGKVTQNYTKSPIVTQIVTQTAVTHSFCVSSSLRRVLLENKENQCQNQQDTNRENA